MIKPGQNDLTTAAAVGGWRYGAFLSYSHADSKWAQWLLRRLEGYRVPTRFRGRVAPVGQLGPRIGPVFRDREELPTTHDLGETIRGALRASATLVVVCSPDSAHSRWVLEEIVEFKRLHGEERVFAFIVGGEPKFAGAADDCFSPALRFALGPDGRPSTTPVEVVAADARPHGDGPKLALIRLIAGLLGVGFDELRRRELQRRNARLTLIASASAVGMAITLTLAITAWRARNDAQRRQMQAEDVLTFMVGDFRTELKKLGRLSLLDAVGDKATAYFDTLDPRDLTDSALASQAKALTQIGENRMDQARYTEAARAFATAYARAAALAARNPNSGEALFGRAQAEYWVGFVNWKRGNLAAASEWMGRYRDTGAELVALDTTKRTWQEELAYGHHNLAVIEMDRGDFDSAREGFRAELRMLTRLSAGTPTDTDLQYRLADVNSWLGSLAEQAGNFPEAAERFAEQARRLDSLMAADGRNAQLKVKLANALALESSLLAITGQRTKSLERRKQARALLEPLVSADPANRTWVSASLSLKLKEAMLLQAEGDLTAASLLVAEARTGLEKINKDEPSARTVAASLATAWRMEAELREAAGRPDASEAAGRAVAIGESLITQARANEAYLGDYIKACVVAGLIARRNGDESGALRRWQTAITAAQPHLGASRYWRLLDPVARALALLGKTPDSQKLIAQLSGLGYQPLAPWP